MDNQRSDALVFFGATGDLAYKEIFPALQALVKRHNFNIPIIGVAKSGWNLEQLKDRARDSLTKHGDLEEGAFAKLISLLKYVDGDYNDMATFTQLREQMGDAKCPLHYLAIPPDVFATVAENLSQSGSANNARVVIEKPFGRDLESAKELNRILGQFFLQSSIYRIDHFLGKEPVQNIIYTRFGNSVFEPIWNRDHIRCIQITMAEDFGVKGRGHFYDEAGAIRDVIQNHLLQVLACLIMDPPIGEGHDALRAEKARILKAVRPLTPSDVVRGQFQGYRDEKGVAPDSNVETFAAMKLFVDTWRWADMPIYIRAGKCLPVTITEILVEFIHPPRKVFGETIDGPSNYLRLRLNPEVTIGLGLRIKKAGEQMEGEDVELIARHQPPDEMEPYERLLGDALNGDSTLFASEEEVESQWRIVDPVLDDTVPVNPYEPDTWGPKQADGLIANEGRWFNPK